MFLHTYGKNCRTSSNYQENQLIGDSAGNVMWDQREKYLSRQSSASEVQHSLWRLSLWSQTCEAIHIAGPVLHSVQRIVSILGNLQNRWEVCSFDINLLTIVVSIFLNLLIAKDSCIQKYGGWYLTFSPVWPFLCFYDSRP